MIEAKVPEGLPKWMSDHVDRYLKSGGKDGHMYTIKPPGMDKQITVPSLLLVTKGRKSGEKYLFPLFYGETGNELLHRGVEGRRAGSSRLVQEHPRQSRGRGAGRHQDGQGQGPHRVGRRACRSCGTAR